ncbi:MAG: hypothetical protein RMK32_08970 [Anaerolineae bacterium]|nr:hypothetical protein [Thermoflexus sp.]MDW8065746.1 hypothetical protein [Anaerolineae bacterium]
MNDRIAFLTEDYLNLVIGGHIYTVRRLGKPVAWSPDGKSLLLTIPQPGSVPLYHLGIIREPNWSWVEYVQKNVYNADANWGPYSEWIVFLGIPDYYATQKDELSEKMGIYILNLRSGEKRKVGDGACNPVWSPDGRMIAVTSHIADENAYGLKIINLGENWTKEDWTGPSSERIIYRFTTKYMCSGTTSSWFPDSRRLLVTDGLKILIVNLEDGSIKNVYEINTPRVEGWLEARLLPDGQHVVYKASYGDGWCRNDEDCQHCGPERGIRTSWCRTDSRCWRNEIVLINLKELTRKNITPKVEDYTLPTHYDSIQFVWWQERQ